MKLFKSKLIFLIISIISIFYSVKAQSDFRPGYVITISGDTVQGYLDFRRDVANASECVFKKTVDQEKIVYQPGQIKSYRFNSGKYYISNNELNYKFKEPVFLEFIIKGSLNVYYYRDKNQDHYFTSKDTLVMELNNSDIQRKDSLTGRTYIGSSQAYIGQLKYLMRDQPIIFRKVEGTECDSKELISLTKEYQKLSCPTQECVQFEKSGKSYGMNYGFYISFGRPSIVVGELSHGGNYWFVDYNFKDTRTIEFGAIINVKLNVINERLSLLVSPGLNFSKYSSNVETQFSFERNEYRKLDISISGFKVPIAVKYSFFSSTKSLIPWVKIGLGANYYLNSKGTFAFDKQSGTVFYHTTTSFSITKKINAFILAGAGVDMKLGKKLLSVGIDFERGSPWDHIEESNGNSIGTLSTYNTLSLRLGLIL